MLKQIVFLVIAAMVLIACNQPSSAGSKGKQGDTTREEKASGSATQGDVAERLSFKTIAEIVAESSSSIWVDKQDSNFSLALHFQYRDTLAISYSPECWLLFPYKLYGNKLEVYWDENIDSKYNFDIVKAIRKIDRKYIGKPFMILSLANDTTLKASYPLPELVQAISTANNQDTFFPAKFNLVQQDDTYD
jgi:hypothetical protein